MSWKSALKTLALPLLGILLLRLFAQSQPTVRATYVDPRTCATCHAQIAQTYARTGMGNSFFRPTSGRIREDFSQATYYHALSDTHFSMTRRGDGLYQKRWQIGADNKQINVEEMKVEYVMGSGNHARSYLARTAADTLIELPLGWFPAETGRKAGWGMSPGSDTTRPLTRRFVSYKCMFCHNAYPAIPPEGQVPDADPVYVGELPQGIDCQRCHGPGSEHVRQSGLRSAIVNPARLSAERSMDVCIQCHLETSSGKIPATLVRFHRGPFSFQPGEAFGDFAISFDHAPGSGHDDKFETVSSVYRLRQSRCFTESAGKMSCLTCHDPHDIPRGVAAVQKYSAVCGQCHAPAKMASLRGHPVGKDCIGCHMPKRRADDIPRMVMTDHFIRRNPPRRLVDLPPPTGEVYQGEVVAYHPSPLPATDENALYRAVAQVGLGNNLERGLPQLMAEMDRQKPRQPQFYLVLGDALTAAGKADEAMNAYREALRLQPDSVRALRSLGTEDTLRKAVELAPRDAESWYRWGLLDERNGRLAPAVEKVRHAIALDPTLPEKSRRLGEMLLNMGDFVGAEGALTDALRVNPYDDAAWDLAGRLHFTKGAERDMRFAFEKAIRLRPEAAVYRFDYGLALARLDKFPEAKAQALAAVRADAGMATAHELLGNLLMREGDRVEAVAHFRQAAKSSNRDVAARARAALRQAGIP